MGRYKRKTEQKITYTLEKTKEGTRRQASGEADNSFRSFWELMNVFCEKA